MSKAWGFVKKPLNLVHRVVKPIINKVPGGSIINAGLDFVL